jgi:hypothetical protein
MKITTVFGLIGLMLVGIVAAAAGTSAFGMGFWQSTDDKQAIQTAIANNDYATWKDLMEQQLTQDNFNQLVQRHQQMSDRQQTQMDIRNAIETSDYEAYVAAVEKIATTEPISEVDFNKLVEIYNAQKSGDYATAKQLRQELGVNITGMPMDFGEFGRGFGRFGFNMGRK